MLEVVSLVYLYHNKLLSQYRLGLIPYALLLLWTGDLPLSIMMQLLFFLPPSMTTVMPFTITITWFSWESYLWYSGNFNQAPTLIRKWWGSGAADQAPWHIHPL